MFKGVRIHVKAQKITAIIQIKFHFKLLWKTDKVDILPGHCFHLEDGST